MIDTVSSLTGLIYAVRPRAVTPPVADRRTIQSIRECADGLRQRGDHELRDAMRELREIVSGKEPADRSMVISCFALVTESSRRTLGVELYDVQLSAGLALARKSIVEMQTGEGKTLSAALAAAAFSLCGAGVHLMTVNAYLAERDYLELLPTWTLLGISAGLLRQDATPEQKRSAYGCDITYGPGYEFGFDYLRDQLRLLSRPRQRLGSAYRNQLRGQDAAVASLLQRGQAFAIVDEADSVMLDEAVTPLILSGASQDKARHPDLYLNAMRLADQLEVNRDYLLDARWKITQLTEYGAKKIRDAAALRPSAGLGRPWSQYVEQALHAKLILRRDVDYVVENDHIMLVDEKTGRIFGNRSWRDGLRQAVEAREGVHITAENESLARISRQRYLRLYQGMCGLTGTAVGVEKEYWQVYRMPVVKIPLRTPSRRHVLPTRFFADQQLKWSAIVKDIERIHRTGQPILVGTRTIEDSQALAAKLEAANISCHLLNGLQDADEADVVAAAGRVGKVTVATNMAGRGTDITLHGGAAELGGLHVIGCEPHDSARVDRQLMGRCARQGDPGTCQSFVSAEDPVIARPPSFARRIQRQAGRTVLCGRNSPRNSRDCSSGWKQRPAPRAANFSPVIVHGKR
ncbi:MAG: preprotein translocase subunit SecA [Pirellulaceae bacterium]